MVNFPINLRCYVLLGCRVINVILAINIGDSAFFDIATLVRQFGGLRITSRRNRYIGPPPNQNPGYATAARTHKTVRPKLKIRQKVSIRCFDSSQCTIGANYRPIFPPVPPGGCSPSLVYSPGYSPWIFIPAGGTHPGLVAAGEAGEHPDGGQAELPTPPLHHPQQLAHAPARADTLRPGLLAGQHHQVVDGLNRRHAKG